MRLQKLLLVLAILAAPLHARPALDVRPAPAWVERVDVDTSVTPAREHVRWGLYDLLSDHQVRGASSYFRSVRAVLSPSGVQNASELELDFDPTFQRLTIHEIKIIRGGKRIDAYEPDEVRVMDKEDSADQRIYDGEKTALVLLRDVRAGDVIDYSYSIDGANPLLAGRYVDEYDLSSGVPTKRIRHRLVWPLARPLQWRGADPKIIPPASEQVFVWEKLDVPALDIEDSIPSWYEPWETVQVSEFASWNEVAQWASALFVLDAKSTEEVKKLAARFYGEHETQEARATAAIRFVQDEIRYLGIEMGRNSHEPHQPWQTLEQRWGDCKDKTLLLVALLRELGLEAYPALVNTRLEHRLGEKLPSPFLFDHVITQALVAGKPYWIDGTISDQGGTLTTIETPNDGAVLIVRNESTGLTKVTTNAKGSTRVEQTYTTTSYAQPTRLDIKTIYIGSDADAMRSYLASMSLDDLASDRINELAADQPKIEQVAKPRIDDDRAANRIVVTEQYRIPELWKEGEWSWYPRVLDAHFRRPDTMIRRMPLAFDYPLHVSQRVMFHFPERMEIEERSSVTETKTFRYEKKIDSNGRSVWIEQSLRAHQDSVAAKDVADHLTQLNSIWDEIGYSLTPNGTDPSPQVAAADISAAFRDVPSEWKWIWVATALFVGVTILSVLAVRRRRRHVILREPLFGPGEAPVSALAIGHVDEIDTRLAEMSCACGASIGDKGDVQRARYADREMTIVIRQCGACGREQSVYFTAA